MKCLLEGGGGKQPATTRAKGNKKDKGEDEEDGEGEANAGNNKKGSKRKVTTKKATTKKATTKKTKTTYEEPIKNKVVQKVQRTRDQQRQRGKQTVTQSMTAKTIENIDYYFVLEFK